MRLGIGDVAPFSNFLYYKRSLKFANLENIVRSAGQSPKDLKGGSIPVNRIVAGTIMLFSVLSRDHPLLDTSSHDLHIIKRNVVWILSNKDQTGTKAVDALSYHGKVSHNGILSLNRKSEEKLDLILRYTLLSTGQQLETLSPQPLTIDALSQLHEMMG